MAPIYIMNSAKTYGTLDWIALIFLAFIWGSSFILMKVGLKTYQSYHVAILRVALSSFVLIPFSIKPLKRLKVKEIKSFLIVGLLGIFGPALLFTTAQTVIDSSIAGMLNSLTPLCTLITGFFFYKTLLNKKIIVGVILGFTGATIIMLTSGNGQFGSISWHALLIILATLFYGISANETKAGLKYYNGFEITSVSIVLMSPILFAFLLFSDFSYITVSNIFWKSTLAIIILSLAGTSFALIIFNSLVKRTSAIFASSVTYIIPIFAILWGLFDNEKLSLWSLTGILFVLYGVYLINRRK